MNFLNNVFTMGSAIIIFGFISTRLPQFRNLGDSSIYEIGYLVIIGLLSIIISYFNKTTNTDAVIDPYLDMFKVLSVLLIVLILASKPKVFKDLINKKVSKKGLIYGVIVFTILGCLASVYTIPVNEAFANVRNLVVMIGSLIGGPFVGIPCAIISGIFRYSMGGPTAFPCSLATVLAGVFGSLIYHFRDKRFLRGMSSVVLMFLYVGFEMFLIILLSPENISIPYIHNIYLLMLFGSVFGMILFIMIIKEVKSGNEINYEELRINELENTLDEYGDKIEKLEEDIEILKKKNDLE
ncbi:LytS/YhcK type 5TM receptor domain-containing protein [Methanobrevibacter sp.]|uniref:LytS/YhcK type 5TM receptor domain-containing protein n=1 Tax=Methanobrevibacter sp. TaxID=66852 RepID=UPI00386F4BEC